MDTMLELSLAAEHAGLTSQFLELKRDAERYRWLRDLLAVEDIHEALMNRIGVDESESLKCDAAVDQLMAVDRATRQAA